MDAANQPSKAGEVVPVVPVAAQAAAEAPAAPKIRHEWYQTDSEVVINVFIRNVKEEDLTVDLQEKSISLNIRLPTGSDIVFDLDPLSHPINVAASSHRVLAPKIELKLLKKEPGIKWASIEGDSSAEVTTKIDAIPDGVLPRKLYPTSSKNKVDWDLLVRDEVDAKGKDSGSGDVNELFKTLYKDATDEQRRAMVKSYQESGGTALSTDWNDVSKKTVPIQPPDGLVAKKWEM